MGQVIGTFPPGSTVSAAAREVSQLRWGLCPLMEAVAPIQPNSSSLNERVEEGCSKIHTPLGRSQLDGGKKKYVGTVLSDSNSLVMHVDVQAHSRLLSASLFWTKFNLKQSTTWPPSPSMTQQRLPVHCQTKEKHTSSHFLSLSRSLSSGFLLLLFSSVALI